MHNFLDLRTDITYDETRDEYSCVCSLWDGDHAICSKIWRGPDPLVLYRMSIPFWLAWSATHYDSPEMTPIIHDQNGLEQMRLPF